LVKLEVFTAEPPCAGCVALLELADKIQENFPEVKLVKHIGMCDEFVQYKITYVPATIIEEGRIAMMGLCPSYDTIVAALTEMGVKK